MLREGIKMIAEGNAGTLLPAPVFERKTGPAFA
jgi:hypothetical protein